MAAVIEIQGLRKTYRSIRRGPRQALDGFDMSVNQGEIHGFLGPNGSGKTTTLRTLLGLIRPNAGRMTILGREVPAALPGVISQIGALVESPQFFPHFSAAKTLSLLADAGNVPQARVGEVLELVGLSDRRDERVKTYSLGMKQRLAVASALLKHPKVLILDEPANGLDPGGIREMRDLTRSLAASGMTIIFSSHILGEVEQICDQVTIISKGRRVVAGTVAQVLASHSRDEIKVSVDGDLRLAEQVLRDAGIGATVATVGGHLVVTGVENPAWITRALATHNLFVSELTPMLADLESVFLEITGTSPVPGQYRQVDTSVQVADRPFAATGANE